MEYSTAGRCVAITQRPRNACMHPRCGTTALQQGFTLYVATTLRCGGVATGFFKWAQCMLRKPRPQPPPRRRRAASAPAVGHTGAGTRAILRIRAQQSNEATLTPHQERCHAHECARIRALASSNASAGVAREKSRARENSGRPDYRSARAHGGLLRGRLDAACICAVGAEGLQAAHALAACDHGYNVYWLRENAKDAAAGATKDEASESALARSHFSQRGGTCLRPFGSGDLNYVEAWRLCC